jgi:hypothetical protein
MKKQKEIIALARLKNYGRFYHGWIEDNKGNENAWYLECCLLQQWLRKTHNLSVVILHFPKYNNKGISKYIEYRYSIIEDNEIWDESERHKSFEEALEEGLEEALKIVKERSV